MGDATDAGVLILFAPLVLAPIFAIAKLIFSLAFFRKKDAQFWRRLIITALAESCLPLATLVAYLPALILVRLVAPGLLDERWFRISAFLLMLYVANCGTNYLLFRMSARDWPRSARPKAIVQAGVFGLIPTILFFISLVNPWENTARLWVR